MKKTLTFIMMVTLMVVALSTIAFAGYMIQPVYQNSDGQRVMDVTNDSGQIVLKVLGRGGNVYNATNGFLVTSNCKGPDYFGVAQNNGSLVIMWVDTSNVLWRTPSNYLQATVKGSYTGGALNTVGTTSNYSNYTSQNTQPSYQQPTYQQPSYQQPTYQQPSYQQPTYQQPSYQQPQTGYNNQWQYSYNDYYYDDYYYSDRISATKSGNTYKYKDGSRTYSYTLRSRKLSYNSYEIADDVTDVAFVEDYIIYVTRDNDVYAAEIGRKSRGDRIFSDFDKISCYDGWMVDYIKVDGRKYDEDDILDRIEDDDWDDDEDNDYDYPYVKKSGQKYTYYKSSSNKYEYTFKDGSVEYKNDEILDEVDTVGFSTKGYIFMLTSDGDLYRLKVGSNSSPSWIDSASYVTVNSDYIITKIVDKEGNSLKTSDYE